MPLNIPNPGEIIAQTQHGANNANQFQIDEKARLQKMIELGLVAPSDVQLMDTRMSNQFRTRANGLAGMSTQIGDKLNDVNMYRDQVNFAADQAGAAAQSLGQSQGADRAIASRMGAQTQAQTQGQGYRAYNMGSETMALQQLAARSQLADYNRTLADQESTIAQNNAATKMGYIGQDVANNYREASTEARDIAAGVKATASLAGSVAPMFDTNTNAQIQGQTSGTAANASANAAYGPIPGESQADYYKRTGMQPGAGR